MKSSSRGEGRFFSTARPPDSSTPKIDLHTHSTYSDGLLSPAMLVEEAASRGVRILALTDHDTVAGIDEAGLAGERLGVEIIPGVELSAALPNGGEVHLLGYFVEIDDPALLAQLAGYARARAERMERMVERLSRIGTPVAMERVHEIAGHGTVGRPHLGRALVEAGYAEDLSDAFARYIGGGKPAFVPRPRVDPCEAIALVRAAGGVPVLAHPFSTGGVESVLDRLVPAGLAGMEVDYGEYSTEDREILREIATRRGLIATGGSDYHGPDRRVARELGSAGVSLATVAALRRARTPLARDRQNTPPVASGRGRGAAQMIGLPAPDRVAAVVVAAGRGERLRTPEKVVLPLAGRPLLAWSLRALEQAETIGPVVVVAGSHTLEAVGRLVRDEGLIKVHAIVAGGERRQDSVAAGLAALPKGIEIVVIHDGARPLAEPELFDRCAAAAAERGAAIAATPVADTLKRVADQVITSTVDRTGLWAAQTPQAFRLELLRQAMTPGSGETVTDEARLCEVAGLLVTVVPSSPANLKVTHAEDIPVADALLRARHGPQPHAGPMRTGIGYDAHRFAAGRRLVLGGVEIAHDRGLEGHSDADVLLHAIADALLGAAGLGDIGQHFPPSDERFRDADSQLLLREVFRLVLEAGWVPGNADATLLAEAPRVAPYVPLMRERIALCLGLSASAVSVKATTNEGMGFIGGGEGIAALATATLIPTPADLVR